MLVPWKKSYDQPRWHIKKQRHYVSDKDLSSQSCIFPVVKYGCKSCTIKKAERRRTDTFELWCWRDSWETLGLQGDLTSPSKWDHSCCSLEGLTFKLIYCFAFTVMLAEVKKLSNVSECISFSGIPQLRKWQGLIFTQFCKVKHNLFKFAKSVPDHQYVKKG